jgi:hypothetical protein
MDSMEPPRNHAGIWGQTTPLSEMASFMNLTIGVICNICIICNYSHLSWHGGVVLTFGKGANGCLL